MDRELAALLRQLSTSDSGGYMANAISGARINRGGEDDLFHFYGFKWAISRYCLNQRGRFMAAGTQSVRLLVSDECRVLKNTDPSSAYSKDTLRGRFESRRFDLGRQN
jgi:hypothetical protein